VFLFVLGICLGSFLNCLVYRLNCNLSLFWGRSFCPKCRKKLPWYDNIPLLSFIFLKGKCRWCHSPIGIHYPLVELTTGLMTLLIFYQFFLRSGIPPSGTIFNFVYILLITYALIGIFLSDLQYRTIPDQIIYPALVVVMIWIIINSQWINILTGIAGAAFFFLLVLLTRFRGMGLGDVKLAGLMGLFLGYPQITVALYLAFLTGATVGVILILRGKKRFKSEISFGPFLVLATFIAWFWGEKIWQIFL
jgi:prepilin signal peptidase PulO-like enzyme (type II secretory pathway)